MKYQSLQNMLIHVLMSSEHEPWGDGEEDPYDGQAVGMLYRLTWFQFNV